METRWAIWFYFASISFFTIVLCLANRMHTKKERILKQGKSNGKPD